MRRWLIRIACISLLSGCAQFIYSDILVFHEIPPTFTGTRYTTIPFKEQEGSLEHRTYEQAVKRELDAKGFREAPLEKAEIVIFLSYGIDTGKEMVESYPIIGQTGVSSSQTFGTVQSSGGFGTYSGSTTYTPTYGVVGTGVTSYTVYTRFLKLDILDKKSLTEKQVKKIYEAKVTSRGSSGQLPEVLPTLIKALFEEFPGKSGSTRRSRRHIEE